MDTSNTSLMDKSNTSAAMDMSSTSAAMDVSNLSLVSLNADDDKGAFSHSVR